VKKLIANSLIKFQFVAKPTRFGAEKIQEIASLWRLGRPWEALFRDSRLRWCDLKDFGSGVFWLRFSILGTQKYAIPERKWSFSTIFQGAWLYSFWEGSL